MLLPFLKSTRMSAFTLAAATLLNGASVMTACAEGFPGKGSSGDWSDALPYYNRGNKYLSHGRYEDAVNDYNEAISKYPYDPDFYTNLGVAYRKLEDYAHEEECFKKAVQLNPKDWVPLNDLANAYLKQNKLKETIATYEKTLKLNPPAAQKAAILGDIKDITKILRLNGQL
ncbi:MAG TPA: tetratricopeptide repeat protein, partial [Chroococcales cyanobacterium]